MISRLLLAGVSLAALAASASAGFAATLPFPQYGQLGKYRAAGENPRYHVNEYGYGNYVQGPDGSIGGYPAGSDGARELQTNQELRCRYSPESC